MKFLPFQSFTIETSDPVSVVARKLSDKIDHSWGPWFPWFFNEGPPYVGMLWEDGFKVASVLRYRNPGHPVICGHFETGPNGTIIHITMRLHWGNVALLILFCVFHLIGLGASYGLASIFRGEHVWLFVLVNGFVWLTLAGVTCAGFWLEASEQREAITRLLIDPIRQPFPPLLPKWPSDDDNPI